MEFSTARSKARSHADIPSFDLIRADQVAEGSRCAYRNLQGRRPLFNLLNYAVPVLSKLTEDIRFPDMAILYNMWDNPPIRRLANEPGPWFGYCGIRQELNSLLLPFELSDFKVDIPSEYSMPKHCSFMNIQHEPQFSPADHMWRRCRLLLWSRRPKEWQGHLFGFADWLGERTQAQSPALSHCYLSLHPSVKLMLHVSNQHDKRRAPRLTSLAEVSDCFSVCRVLYASRDI